MSKITIKNNINSELSMTHADNKPAKSIIGTDIAVAIDTINDFSLDASDGDTVIVRDLDRGGTFIYDNSKVAEHNDGTNFNGWVRQYSGAVNIKWFGAEDASISNDSWDAIQKALDSSLDITFDNKEYKISKTLNIREGLVLQGDNTTLTFTGGRTLNMFEFSAGEVESNIIINGFIFDGGQDITTAWESGIKGDCLLTINSSILSNCTLKNFRNDGVGVGSNCTVSSCVFDSIGDNAFTLSGNHSTVSDCVLHNIGGDGYLIKSNYNTVTNITMDNIGNNDVANGQGGSGVAIGSDSTGAFNNIVSNHTMTNINSCGVTVLNGRHNSVYNITVENADIGVHTGDNENINISNININSCATGISLLLRYSTVSNCTIRDCVKPLFVDSNSGRTTISSINFRGQTESAEINGSNLTIENISSDFTNNDNNYALVINANDSTLKSVNSRNTGIAVVGSGNRLYDINVLSANGKGLAILGNANNTTVQGGKITDSSGQEISVGDYNASASSTLPNGILITGMKVGAGGARAFTGSNMLYHANLSADMSVADYADSNTITNINNVSQ